MMAPQQLDQLVGPVALYPDGLLAQVLTASTFGYELPDAANWANNHSYLHLSLIHIFLRAHGLSKFYQSGHDQLTVLANIDLEVQRGERLALTGESGAGKSTLLHLLGGLDSPCLLYTSRCV